jgi:hypothetical protein
MPQLLVWIFHNVLACLQRHRVTVHRITVTKSDPSLLCHQFECLFLRHLIVSLKLIVKLLDKSSVCIKCQIYLSGPKLLITEILSKLAFKVWFNYIYEHFNCLTNCIALTSYLKFVLGKANKTFQELKSITVKCILIMNLKASFIYVDTWSNKLCINDTLSEVLCEKTAFGYHKTALKAW